ncbi:MAG: Na/Pi symporter [Bacteroidales bacterium]|nr:Na/Pi symporter [Bacteroidales bacterium]
MKKTRQLWRNALLLLSFLSVFSFSTKSQDYSFKLEKPVSGSFVNYSGDNQHQSVGNKIDKPVRVLVTSNGKPMQGIPVKFSFLDVPEGSKSHYLIDSQVYTNANGIAENYLVLGEKAGDYEIIASVNSELIVYKLHARKSDWWLMLSIGLLGGLALFLFGMHLMGEGLQKSAGRNMRSILSTLTKNRFMGVGVGALVTTIIQSSSATTVMLVSFVNSGLMKFNRTIGVILGAAIGTTITAQLIAFKLTDYSLLFIAVGFSLQFFTKSDGLKSTGQAILGFGILFFGMEIMSESMSPLRFYEPFIESIVRLENPLLGVLAGAIFTALVQSSSAFIGIMIVISMQGLLSLEAAIPLVFGANIGTAVTAILASINTNVESKKVALAQTIIKISGVAIFVMWIPVFAEFIKGISPEVQSTDNLSKLSAEVPRQIANTHTVFNIVLTAIFLPIVGVYAKFIDRLLPSKIKEDKKMQTKFLDKQIVATPAIALNLAKQETVRMCNVVQDMVNDILLVFFLKDKKLLKEIKEKEELTDYLRTEINSYLINISQANIQKERAQEAFQIMYTIKEIEQIGDIVATNLGKEAEKWIESEAEFSEAGKKELVDYHLRAQKQISRAIEVFRDVNLKKALTMKEKFKKYSAMANTFDMSHYNRLFDQVGKSLESSKTHLELMGMFRAITNHATNIARLFLDQKEK